MRQTYKSMEKNKGVIYKYTQLYLPDFFFTGFRKINKQKQQEKIKTSKKTLKEIQCPQKLMAQHLYLQKWSCMLLFIFEKEKKLNSKCIRHLSLRPNNLKLQHLAQRNLPGIYKDDLS